MIELRDRERWIAAVLADPEMTAQCKVVAVRLALHHNIGTGRCDPSVDGLAAGACCTSRAVEKAIAFLDKAGWISRSSTRGRHRNRYQLRVERASAHPSKSPDDESETLLTPNGNSGFKQMNPERRDASTPNGGSPQPRTAIRANREENREKEQRKDSPQNPSSHDHRDRGRSAEADSEPEGFSEWWVQYPRRTGEDGARRAYAQIVREGRASPSELMDGVRRYAATRIGQEERYTTTPINWLRNGCWSYQPAPQLQARIGNGFSELAERKARGDWSVYRSPWAHLDDPADHAREADDDDTPRSWEA
ncbi:hypothetical protein AEGHOMDF_3022 [Methylobacterium soli]|nr:hypothetical protein AEGHOMDF_3022 [Methylobacterium soli]